ncbi:MAG: hypothetical protein M1375_04375 [Candidatus Thermoplasmatota archaeon]|nr:hypothetical protein [Candidatus Thermoplasmatota archaeon]
MISYFIRNITANRRMIFWSIGVSIVIGVLTVLSLKIGRPTTNISVYRQSFALSFAFVYGFSCSTSAAAISASYASQSRSFGFLFKRLNISKTEYTGSLLTGIGVAFLMNAAILFPLELILIELRFGYWALPPDIVFSIPLIFLVSVADGLIFAVIALAITSVILIISGFRLLSLAKYFPFLLYIITFILMTNGLHGILEDVFPYSSVFYIFNFLYTGSDTFYMNVIHPFQPDLIISSLSIGIYLVVSAGILYFLMDHIYIQGGENDRQF